MDIEKRAQHLTDRLSYIRDIFVGRNGEIIDSLGVRLDSFFQNLADGSMKSPLDELVQLEKGFDEVERLLDSSLTPMEKVRIVRHPQRFCLRDILENVYDNLTEIGGQDEHSIDPSMVIARATITRHQGKKKYSQLIMVIGQERAMARNSATAGP